MINDIQEPFIIMKDFNGHHHVWGVIDVVREG